MDLDVNKGHTGDHGRLAFPIPDVHVNDQCGQDQRHEHGEDPNGLAQKASTFADILHAMDGARFEEVAEHHDRGSLEFDQEMRSRTYYSI